MMTDRTPDTVSGSLLVALVVSPQAGMLQDARSPRVLLERAGLHVAEQLGVIDLAGEEQVGKRWRQRGYRAVVAAGGDGTIGTTASCLAGTGIPLGILPMGTSNNIARALDIPLDPATAAAVIVDGVPTDIDTGLVVEVRDVAGTTDNTGTTSDSARRLMRLWRPGLPQWLLNRWGRHTSYALHFLHAATLGLNAEFAHLATDAGRRATLGSFTYPAASLEALLKLRRIAVTLHLSGVPARDPATGQRLAGIANESQLSLATEVVQLAVVNTPLFGGALNLRLPGVDARDHLLDIILIEPPSLNKHLDIIQAVMGGIWASLGRLRNRKVVPPASPLRRQQEGEDHALAGLTGDALFPGIRRYQARAVSISTAAAVELTLDGEVRAHTPAEIRVAPGTLAVLLPDEGTADHLGGNTEGSTVSPSNKTPA